MNDQQHAQGRPRPDSAGGTSTADTWIGSTIDGRYTITRRIARGGMSTVYLARDQRLNRDVAIKVLFPHMAEDRKVVQRFEQEARNSALVTHPNVVQVLDQGQTRETAYMVMEYVPGATLRTLLKKGPMTPRLALTYLQSILAGLAAAHRAGLVHRDIKPENVLVSTEGHIKLADFGLARAATHHSGTSTLMGTVAYISPELLSGEGADERADIYAMGILLYEMLTGVQPYTGDSPVRVAFQHVNSTVPAPSSYVPGLAAPLDDLVREATRINPADRPKNADALLGLLEEAREELSPEDLDFDGALAKHRRHHPHASPAAAPLMPPAPETGGALSAGTPEHAEGGFEEDEPTYTPAAGTAAPTAPTTVAEDFPTVDDTQVWDEDITAALGHAKAAGAPRPQAPAQSNPWSTLDVAERQTVAEVPLPGQLSVHDPETSHFTSVAPQEPARGDRKDRQRPRVSLHGPTPTQHWIAVAVMMIATALLMLLGYYLGASEGIIPSLPTTSPE
ncbi:protein kinase domain-containing protein [Nesterenkonia flava]|uniref:Protein kinase n=1 Tax=Nesterenkonia flava TaxID=469799 RepID=A0ABU1FWE4_9MICC|nr:protein kinase [Nesterenkonia flava]MDR5713005.1 protein kinase [Nesterenkonia flava]